MKKSFNYKLKKDSAKGLKFGIVTSNWNKNITDKLLRKTIETLLSYGANKSDIHIQEVPGAFELIYAAKKIAKQKIDAIIVLGCIIQGKTPHFEYISHSVSLGIKDLNVLLNKPVIFGVLTTKNLTQAKKRSNGKENKGFEFAISAIEMAKI